MKKQLQMVYYLNNCLATVPNLYINWKKPQQILMNDQENNLSNFYSYLLNFLNLCLVNTYCHYFYKPQEFQVFLLTKLNFLFPRRLLVLNRFFDRLNFLKLANSFLEISKIDAIFLVKKL